MLHIISISNNKGSPRLSVESAHSSPKPLTLYLISELLGTIVCTLPVDGRICRSERIWKIIFDLVFLLYVNRLYHHLKSLFLIEIFKIRFMNSIHSPFDVTSTYKNIYLYYSQGFVLTVDWKHPCICPIYWHFRSVYVLMLDIMYTSMRLHEINEKRA